MLPDSNSFEHDWLRFLTWHISFLTNSVSLVRFLPSGKSTGARVACMVFFVFGNYSITGLKLEISVAAIFVSCLIMTITYGEHTERHTFTLAWVFPTVSGQNSVIRTPTVT